MAELIVSAAVPEEASETGCVVEELTLTLPKLRLVELRLSLGVVAFSCRAKVFVTLPAEAVRVAVCAVETAAALAEKLALVAPEATVTEAGTVTDELLLARLTLKPELGAGLVSRTVQASVAAPVAEAALQLTPLSAGVALLAAV